MLSASRSTRTARPRCGRPTGAGWEWVALAWGAGIWHLLFYGYSALTVLFATRELGMSAGMLGLAQMLGGIGVFVSSQVIKPLNARYGAGVTMLMSAPSASISASATGPMLPAGVESNVEHTLK